MDILQHLNAPQLQAVQHREGPLLILAGAGSGKTRVITCRIAYLIEELRVDPSQILAMTFTNKAADEMRERVDHLLARGEDARRVTISTFHSLGARLLRHHARHLGLSAGFHIYDDDDQLRLIRQVLEQNGGYDRSEARRLRGFIESMKNQGMTPAQAHEMAYSQQADEDATFYERYQDALRGANCVDFGDLILGPLELFRAQPSLARGYSEHWRYIMVDEFQDTNPAQYELLQHLTATHRNLAVVGDDDQAIYRWRGATVANILGFEDRFDGVEVIKLEQNYRSSQLILDAANDVIQHNPSRHDKRLWTERDEGKPITVFTAADDREEAIYVAETIQERVRLGADYHDVAVFYRTNAQGRAIEEQLRYHGVPYRVIGGVSFYARQEIKDVLAYLKVAVNPANDVALRRVLNTPPRGIGKATIEKLTAAAEVPSIGGLFGALRYALGGDGPQQHDLFDRRGPRPKTTAHHVALEQLDELRGVSAAGVQDFHEVIEAVRDDLAHFDNLATVVEHLLDRLHYADYLDQHDPERAEDKKRNVDELLNALEEFERDFDDEDTPPLAPVDGEPADDHDDGLLAGSRSAQLLKAFLERSALVQSTDDVDDVRGAVTLMTVHGSKGLEFDTVFLIGLEDELFPSRRDGDPEALEEERRLAYVAITRAQNHLYLTNARRRRLHGKFKDTRPSPFILDIAPERLEIDPRSTSESVDYRGGGRSQSYDPQNQSRNFQFFEGGVDRGLWEFDQSPEMIRGQLGRAVTRAKAAARQQSVDEFSQLPPAWDLPPVDDVPSGEAVQWSPPPTPESDDPASLVGATASHTKFGLGKVVAVSGKGDKARLTIDFVSVGMQTIVRKFVKILG